MTRATLFGHADRMARLAHALARSQAMTRAGIRGTSHDAFMHRLGREARIHRAYLAERRRVREEVLYAYR